MDKEEVKLEILRRFYAGVMKQGMHYQFSFDAFQEEIGIDFPLAFRIHEEFDAERFFGHTFVNREVCPSAKALLYCERHQLVDEAIVRKQEQIRIKILEVCVDNFETRPYEYGDPGDEICRRAGIGRQAFDINAGILGYCGYVERQLSFDIWRVSQPGKELVKELRKRRKRLADFKKLKDGTNIRPQIRGHSIEDLLAEVMADEGWKVSKRVRTEGAEEDLIINKDRDYFLISCKWEKAKKQWKEVSPLLSEAEWAGCYAGIMFSMSGFTARCISRTKARKTPQKILLFGAKDVESLFSNAEQAFSQKHWFSDLLDEKIQKLVHRNAILVDGNEY